MIRSIVKYPDEGLKSVCEPILEVDDSVRKLAQDMVETMYAAPGVGLAAPQVGENRRLIVVDQRAGEDSRSAMVLINPEVVEAFGGYQKEEEGCLSLPGLTAFVKRPRQVKVTAMDLEGQWLEILAEGFLARVLCHEIDHLDGVLYLDRISPLKRDLLRRKIKKLIKANEW